MPVLGILIGTLGAVGATRLLSHLLFGIQATDPLTYALVVVSLLAVAFMACLLPARRAAHVDPIVALRQE